MKNRIKRVALYDPYLDTLGGGEKHVLSILEVFAEQGYQVTIFWDKNLTKEIKNRFSLQFIDQLDWQPNIFKDLFSFRNLGILKNFDYFFYVTDGSYFFSSAKKNFVFSMIPNKNLYKKSLLNRAKLFNYRFISNSSFTQKWLKRWGVKSTVVLPYIDRELFQNKNVKKEKIVLSVGRFFPHLHKKNHEEIIKAFKKLKNKSKEFNEYKLILAGGIKKEDQLYFNKLKQSVKKDSSIIFKPNLPLNELQKLYKISNYFWHFTGLGVNENQHPEMVEHLGITPLEAMASGCLTFCYGAGGPKELIADGKNGFLFSNVNQLIKKMIKTNANESLKKSIISNGVNFVKKYFAYEVFKKNIFKII